MTHETRSQLSVAWDDNLRLPELSEQYAVDPEIASGALEAVKPLIPVDLRIARLYERKSQICTNPIVGNQRQDMHPRNPMVVVVSYLIEEGAVPGETFETVQGLAEKTLALSIEAANARDIAEIEELQAKIDYRNSAIKNRTK